MGRQDPDRRLLPERDHSNIRGPHKGPDTKLPRSTPVRTTTRQTRRHITRQPSKPLKTTPLRETCLSSVAIRALQREKPGGNPGPPKPQLRLKPLTPSPQLITSARSRGVTLGRGAVDSA